MEGSTLRQKYFTYSLIITAIFVGALCHSILAPFYPAKAAEKGVSPSQYGFVFGIFQLVICLSAPIYGRYMAVIGPTFMFKAGVFVTGSCTLMFGFLDKSPPGDTFLGLSYAVRIVAGFGESALFTAAYTIVPTLFPESVGTAVSFIETAFGIGGLIGPAVGGALFQLGGFLLPFEVVGVLMVATAAIAFFAVPTIRMEKNKKESKGALQALAIPGVVLMLTTTMTCSVSVGFIQAVLEPHVRDFHLEAWVVGLVFMTNGIMYAIMATVWGRVIDKNGKYMAAMILSKVISSAAYLFLGPAPFIPIKKSLPLVVVGLACNGFGVAGTLVSSYMGMLDTLTKHKFPNDLQTQGIVAGMFNFSYSLGAFIGPSIAGTLYDSIGFAYGSLVVFGILCAVTIALVIYALTRVKRKKSIGVMLVSVTALNTDAVNGIIASNGKLQQPPSTTTIL